MSRNPVTVITYHRNGTIVETQWRNMREAQEYMTLALKRNTVAECEFFA